MELLSLVLIRNLKTKTSMNMKKTIILVISVFCVIGCERAIVPDHEDGKMIKVSLALAGDVTTEDYPLHQTRAGETDSNDLYGIQVYQDDTPYAYGLFDDVSDVNIYLHSDKTYSFICSSIKPGKYLLKKLSIQSRNYVDYGGHRFYNETGYGDNIIISGPSSGYGYPFNVYAKGINGYIEALSSPSNEFKYSTSDYFKSLSTGECSLSASESRVYYPKLYRYYGEASNYTPLVNSTVTINMKQTGFGLKYIVQGVTDGTASITIKNDKRTFFSNTDISSSFTSDGLFFQYENVKDAWQYADDYAENVTVSMTWLRGVGVNQDLGSQVVQVKRNRLNVITVSLSTSTRSDSIDKPNVKITVDSI